MQPTSPSNDSLTFMDESHPERSTDDACFIKYPFKWRALCGGVSLEEKLKGEINRIFVVTFGA